MTAQVARASGVFRVIVVGRGIRLELPRQLGAEPSTTSRATRSRRPRATGGRGVDRVYECAGSPEVVNRAIGATRRAGRVALLGLTGGKTVDLSPDALTIDEIDVMGIRSSPNAYSSTIALIASVVAHEPLLTHVYPLEHIGEASARSRAVRRSARSSSPTRRTDRRPG